jgi:hypothetical protein
VPFIDFTNGRQLTPMQLKEWALLDTFDMLTPKDDNRQTESTARRWIEKANFLNIEIGRWAHFRA